MQKDPLISALVGALFLGALVTLALGIGYELQVRKMNRLQGPAIAIQNKKMIAEGLVVDSMQYSRTHPAIAPILSRAGINVPPVTK